MAHTVIVHLMNEDPLLAETERLPEPGDVSMALSSPRRRDGRRPHYLSQDITQIILPMHRVSFIEVIPDEKEEEEEEVVFYRD
ncbi:MAG: hypothetical protein WBH57_13320 [Anaerolineae bacterium]